MMSLTGFDIVTGPSGSHANAHTLNSRRFGLALLLFLTPLLPNPALAATIDQADLVNVDADTTVNTGSIFHNRRARRSTTNVSISHTGASAIDTPLILVIESISNASITVANADGTTIPDGKPYFDYTGQVPGDTLDPGESTATRPLVFNNPMVRPFSFQASVFQQIISPLPPPRCGFDQLQRRH